MTKRDDYLSKAESYLKQAGDALERTYSTFAERAATSESLTRIAHAYITLANTPEKFSISGPEWRREHNPPAEAVFEQHRADKINELYGTPSDPVQDNSVSDENTLHEIESIDVQATFATPLSYDDAIKVLKHRFPEFRVTEIDVNDHYVEATLAL